MLARPPQQREWVSWLAVAAWSALIFAFVPVARALEEQVSSVLGEQAFLYGVLLAVAAGVALAVHTLRGVGRVSAGRIAWLLATALAYALWAASLRADPVEAVHFVLYGVLGVLAFRALAHRTRDSAIYPAAALVGAIVGMLDEALQWAAPRRVWDLRDIGINLAGASLVQVGIAAGIRPSWVRPLPSPDGLRRLIRIAALATILLVVSLLNTPARIGWYTDRIPALAFVREDAMLEYGHRFEDPEAGLFRSRLSPQALAESDARRGPEAGGLLDDYPDERYAEFLARYTPITDPFLHEVRVHVFRRDYYLRKALEPGVGPEEAGEAWTIAHRENLLLERYYPVTLAHSGSVLAPEQRARLAREQRPGPYESRVSRAVATRFGERHVLAGGILVLVALLALHEVAGRAKRRGASP